MGVTCSGPDTEAGSSPCSSAPAPLGASERAVLSARHPPQVDCVIDAAGEGVALVRQERQGLHTVRVTLELTDQPAGRRLRYSCRGVRRTCWRPSPMGPSPGAF